MRKKTTEIIVGVIACLMAVLMLAHPSAALSNGWQAKGPEPVCSAIFRLCWRLRAP